MKKQIILSIVASSLLTTSAFGACSASVDMGANHDITLSGTGKIISAKTDTTPALWDDQELVTKKYVTDNSGGAVSITGTVRDNEGNIYTTKLYGTDVWMTQNLKTTSSHDSAITLHNDATWNTTSYAFSAQNGATAGLGTQVDGNGFLYTWNAAMNGATEEGARGLCPVHWHIPTDDEWNNLESALGGDGSDDDVESSARYFSEGVGTKIQSATDFNMPMSGRRDSSGVQMYQGDRMYIWTSNEITTKAWQRYMYNSNAGLGRQDRDKTEGAAVRCIKD